MNLQNEIDTILKMWDVDSKINKDNLTDETIKSSIMHSKYLSFLTLYKIKLNEKKSTYDILLKQKYLWYRKKLSKEEMDTLGWDYDPFKGLSILKGDVEKFHNADSHIIKAKNEIESIKIAIELLTEIISSIRWRSSSIKNIIEWKKFTAGI